MNWVDYWNGSPTIYVSQRHQEAHDACIAASVIPFIAHSNARVLDIGCGDATSAPLVARHCGELLLWDAAEAVRQRLSRRFEASSNITVLSPDALAALESGSMDLITVISVVQYMDDQALSRLLKDCSRLLSESGQLLIGDVIPPDVGIAQDAWQLIRFGRREGFAAAALLGLAKTATSGYVKMRSSLALRKYSTSEFLALLAAHGFSGQQLPRNNGHNQFRKSYLARRLGVEPEQTAGAGFLRVTDPA